MKQNATGVNQQKAHSTDHGVAADKKVDKPIDDNLVPGDNIDDKTIMNDDIKDNTHVDDHDDKDTVDDDDKVDDNQDNVDDSHFDVNPQDIDNDAPGFVTEPAKNDQPQKINETPKDNQPTTPPTHVDASLGDTKTPAPDDLLTDPNQADIYHENFMELERKVIELQDMVDTQREYINSLNPFRVLGFYKELDPKYLDMSPKSKPLYHSPHTGLKKNPNYCDYADIYNLFNPSNVYDHMYFLTDYDHCNFS